MLAKIWAAIEIIRALLKMVDHFKEQLEAQKVANAAEKEKLREKAAQDLKDAKTEEEFNDASDRIHDNSH